MRSILYLILIICISGCGVFKKVHKEKTVDKIQTSLKTKTDSTGLSIDKSFITVKEKLDTVIKIPGKTIQQNTPFSMDSLINGMTAVKNDLLDVRLTLNPITNILSIVADLKPADIPLQLDKETIKQNDITQYGSKTAQSHQKTEKSHDSTVVDKTPKNSFWFTVLIWGVVVIVIFAVYRYFN